MDGISRRIVEILLILGMLAGAACTPAAAPSPTAASKPAPTAASSAKPTEAAASNPGAAATQGAASSPKADSKPAASPAASSQWEQMVAAANKEGKVVVGGGPTEQYRNAALAFKKSYPDIQIEFYGLDYPEFKPRLMAERDGGQYLWDIYIDGAGSPLLQLKPANALAPFKSDLLLPEVMDNSKWVGGLEDGWMDKDHQLIYAFQGGLIFAAWVNRDIAKESELNSMDQLLDPKWKGKIALGDPRVTGPASGIISGLFLAKGEDWFRKLLAQDVIVMTDGRMLAEAVMRGTYPVGIGISIAQIESFRQQGLGANVKALEPDTIAGGTISSGNGNIMLIDRAPHPNAAKVFINWQLSIAGQKAYVDETGLNSRRLDVPGPPEYAPRPGLKYQDPNREELLQYKSRTTEVAKELLK